MGCPFAAVPRPLGLSTEILQCPVSTAPTIMQLDPGESADLGAKPTQSQIYERRRDAERTRDDVLILQYGLIAFKYRPCICWADDYFVSVCVFMLDMIWPYCTLVACCLSPADFICAGAHVHFFFHTLTFGASAYLQYIDTWSEKKKTHGK